MARRCYFQAKLEHLPPLNPPAIVFTCPVVYLGSQFSRERLLQIRPSLQPTLPSGIGSAMVLMTSQTLRLDQSFLQGLSLCGRVLRTRLSLLILCLVGRWSSSKGRDPSRPHCVYSYFRFLGAYLSLCKDRYELAFV